MRIGIIAAGVGTATTFNLTYVPEFLYYVQATQLQNMKFNIEGDGTLIDVDTAGLNLFHNLRLMGIPTDGHLLRLTNGFIPGKNVDLTITNGVAAAIDLFGFSMHKNGTLYFVKGQTTVLANSGRDFRDFSLLGLPGMSAVIGTDTVNVTYEDGQVQRYEAAEINAITGGTQNLITDTMFDNYDQRIKVVSFQPATQQTAYFERMQTVGNIYKIN